ncbi:terminase large subunit [Massilia sp. RP-1-19]|uniref:Terminase large subunit n=1 Tax=Massilia polaris TaxID=2728846 RepID=A0A848HT13_9BURK|nr:terminase TerL endonuclease subunit [Massilia polaris]NML61818.1 terminase large subunit [Massilia polaris]
MAKKTKETSSPVTASGQRDYIQIAIDYAQAAVDDKDRKRFGKWVRLAAKRFLDDLRRAKKKGNSFIFDEWHAIDACDFIEKLPHVEGTWDTENVVMHPSHVLFVVCLFGFRNQDGTRRFTTALFAVARKNAKSFLCSAILLYCFCCEVENGPQVISAATTGSQARIVFNVAKRIVEKVGDLREQFTLEPFANAIARYEVGGTFKPINAKASTQDGLNPSHCGIDEIHAHKTHDLLNVLKSAAGARRNPLFLYTTTEGYESPGPWGEIRHFAKQLLEGVVEADHFLAIYFAVDDEDKAEGIPADDDFDESKWIKANPLMEVNPLLMKEIRKEAIEAKSMPGRHAEFKIKRLNRPSAAAGGWVNLVKWKACKGAVDLEWLRQFPCWGGLDLASTRDLTSFRLVWNVDGVLYTHGWRFVPGAAVHGRTERGLVPYQAWVQGGILIESGAEVTDYDAVEACILKAKADFNLQMVGYDGWNAKQLVQKLQAANVPMQEFIQGPKSYHPAMQALEIAYVGGNLAHGNDPVLNWCASNLIARTDQNMNTAPDKKKAPEKIDDMCALLMAIGVMQEAVEIEPTPGIYIL